MKYFLLLLLLFFILWKPLARLRGRATRNPVQQPGTASAPTGAVDDIVPCAHCGLHLPRSESVGRADSAARFCCPEHRDLGPRAHA